MAGLFLYCRKKIKNKAEFEANTNEMQKIEQKKTPETDDVDIIQTNPEIDVETK